jgi:asparagine synthase (glutamine-hydrolysing)
MWALAWIDIEAGRVLLSRDRFGIKPLYIYRGGQSLYFASEIKAILAGSRERFPINVAVAGRYLQQSLQDAQNETFFHGIETLPAGHSLCFDLGSSSQLSAVAHPFWSVPEHDIFDGDLERRVDGVREMFIDAVRLRLRSDVPVGVLLSGGLDSSSIAAAMQLVLGKDADLHVLSAVSDDPHYDEQPFIDRMATRLGCPVHKFPLRFQPEEAFRLLDTVTYYNDEPVGSFSTVAHYLLMQRARELGVTVILSGQGADELLCGYKKYLGFQAQSLIRRGRWGAALKLLSGFLRQGTVLPQFHIQEAKRYLPKALRPRQIDISGAALQQTDYLLDPGLGNGSVTHRQRLDVYRFSVPSLVHYEDRMSMAFGREIRLPFLDYRMVSMLLPMAPEYKLRSGWTKWVFRKAMERHLPAEITWRKDKQGFVNPQSEWLKHRLRSRVEKLFNEEMLIASCGLINQQALRQLYAQYQKQPAGKGSIWYQEIFNPLALELWARRFEPYLSV